MRADDRDLVTAPAKLVVQQAGLKGGAVRVRNPGEVAENRDVQRATKAGFETLKGRRRIGFDRERSHLSELPIARELANGIRCDHDGGDVVQDSCRKSRRNGSRILRLF